jgi:hypothetical protein
MNLQTLLNFSYDDHPLGKLINDHYRDIEKKVADEYSLLKAIVTEIKNFKRLFLFFHIFSFIKEKK